MRKGVNIKPIKVGGSGIHSFSKTHPEKLPEALEAGTVNSHGIAGLLAALEFQEKMGRENIFQREKMLTNRLYQGLRTIPGVKIYGEKKEEKAPIVAVNFLDYDSAEVADELAERYGICLLYTSGGQIFCSQQETLSVSSLFCQRKTAVGRQGDFRWKYSHQAI